MESLVESILLEQLWSCLADHEGKEKLTLLKFILSRVTNESKHSNTTGDVMELAAESTKACVQSDLSGDVLVNKIINERNLPFLETNYQSYSSHTLNNEAAAIKEAFVSETTDLDNSSILIVCM